MNFARWKSFSIYLVILFVCTSFFTALFYSNRLQYLKNSLSNSEATIRFYTREQARIDNLFKISELRHFVDYVNSIKLFYPDKKKAINKAIHDNSIYDFIGVLNPNNEYEIANRKDFENIIDVRKINKLDSISVFIKYSHELDKAYRIFVAPIFVKDKLDSFIVAYLDISYLFNESYYFVSRDGAVLNKQYLNYFNLNMDTFSSIFPSEWSMIQGSLSGQVITENGIFTYILLNSINKIDGANIEDTQYYLLHIKPIDKNDSPYFINSFKILIKYLDFRINIMYWIISYIWIFISSILFYIVILDRIKQGTLANFDYMTGALNRRGGTIRINKLVSEYHKKGFSRLITALIARVTHFRRIVYSLHFCVIDFDGLKTINDRLGHKSGDELIIFVVNQLRKYLHQGELLIRIGGDEFVILFINRDMNSINTYWSNMTNIFNDRSKAVNRNYSINVSHGIVEYTGNQSVEDCIKRADELMYEDKKRHKVNLFFN